jgi:hypothetical protein
VGKVGDQVVDDAEVIPGVVATEADVVTEEHRGPRCEPHQEGHGHHHERQKPGASGRVVGNRRYPAFTTVLGATRACHHGLQVCVLGDDHSELLNAPAFLLGHIDVARRINGDAMRQGELAGVASRAAAKA